MSPLPGGKSVLFYLFWVDDILTTFFLEPKESPKPQPIGSMLMVVLLTTCTICFLFLLWRRADVLKRAVSHQCEKKNLLNRYYT